VAGVVSPPFVLHWTKEGFPNARSGYTGAMVEPYGWFGQITRGRSGRVFARRTLHIEAPASIGSQFRLTVRDRSAEFRAEKLRAGDLLFALGGATRRTSPADVELMVLGGRT
jgi:hypothetical protein